MRRNIVVLVVIITLLLPQVLQSKKVHVKLAFGLATGGNVEDILMTQSKYVDYKSSGEMSNTTLSYLKFYEGGEPRSLEDTPTVEFDYRVRKASLSGYLIRVGLKFTF